jgi:hypothetical protein
MPLSLSCRNWSQNYSYLVLNWIEISNSTLDVMYPYKGTTLTAKISVLGQTSFEYCNVQQIAKNRFYLDLDEIEEIQGKSNFKFPKTHVK